MSDEMIDRLVGELRPVGRHTVIERMLVGLGGGVITSAVLMLLWLGPRPDLMPAMETGAFWVKLAYALTLSLLGLWATLRLARPAGEASAAGIAAALAVAALAVLAVVQFSGSGGDERVRLVVGSTALGCPWNIVALSVPVFIGIVWAMRGLAPTRLTYAGAVAGLAAGAWGALVYSFHCYESGMPFIALWYSAGIVIAGAIGAALGRYVLRW
jgi:hypothetical protein